MIRGIIHFPFGQDARIMKWDKIITTEQEYEKALATLAIIFKADPDGAEGMEISHHSRSTPKSLHLEIPMLHNV